VRAPGRRARRILIVVVALLVINVPYAVHQWQLHRVGSDGISVTATVVSTDVTGDDVVVSFKLPASVDPDQKVRTARVDAKHGAAAAASGALTPASGLLSIDA